MRHVFWPVSTAVFIFGCLMNQKKELSAADKIKSAHSAATAVPNTSVKILLLGILPGYKKTSPERDIII